LGRVHDEAADALAAFEGSGSLELLGSAIAGFTYVVEALPLGHPNRAAVLSNLGAALCTRFEWAGDTEDLDAAIRFGRQALEAIPTGPSDRASSLSNLAASLARRFERTGRRQDLDEAITLGRQAVDAASAGHPDYTMFLSNLGAALRTRFERTADRQDLDEAITLSRQAVDATPAGHPERVGQLSNLMGSLVRRFERTADRQDLDEAIALSRQAVDATPADHPERTMLLSNLGTALRTRFERTGDGQDLNEAISVGRQAVDATPAGHPQLAGYLSNLGASLCTRFERSGDGRDLNEAISVGRQAVDATPAGHPERAGYLFNLGRFLHTRFERSEDGADLDAAVSLWREASNSLTASPQVRLTAAWSWARAAMDTERLASAAKGYATAVTLLPEVAWHGLGPTARAEHLSQWPGLAADAAASAILAGNPELAMEMLEQGRSLLWTQALHLRSDLTDLIERAPDLARQLGEIRTALDTPLSDAEATSGTPAAGAEGTLSQPRARQEQAIAHRAELARKWDALLCKVRGMKGLEYFLAPVPYARLRQAAVGGPVVVVNASRNGCHSLIVTIDRDVQVVPLPDLTVDTAYDQAMNLAAVVSRIDQSDRTLSERKADRHAILDVLDWLWDTIADPVLTALEHTEAHQPGDTWPRVWWCPTGPLTGLPLHAAGHHPRLNRPAPGRVDCVPERVISSYTPTLTSLLRAQGTPVIPAPARQLVVAMPTTPGQPDLPAAEDELNAVAAHFSVPQHADHLIAQAATRENVLQALRTCSWLHMVCHAHQDFTDPTRSGFALWDGPLTIADLAAEHLDRTDLAFLPACQTATGSPRLLDEAIHLAAATQFLGYRQVLATMWTIDEAPAPDIAAAVYTTLTHHETPDPSRAAKALHHAIESLRAAQPAAPLLWAPYIHIGP